MLNKEIKVINQEQNLNKDNILINIKRSNKKFITNLIKKIVKSKNVKLKKLKKEINYKKL